MASSRLSIFGKEGSFGVAMPICASLNDELPIRIFWEQ
jgi:hypothetical protein